MQNLQKYPLLAHAPNIQNEKQWQTCEKIVTKDEKDYLLIKAVRKNPTAAKICLVILACVFSLGLVFAFARKRMEALWHGIEKERFRLLLLGPQNKTSDDYNDSHNILDNSESDLSHSDEETINRSAESIEILEDTDRKATETESHTQLDVSSTLSNVIKAQDELENTQSNEPVDNTAHSLSSGNDTHTTPTKQLSRLEFYVDLQFLQAHAKSKFQYVSLHKVSELSTNLKEYKKLCSVESENSIEVRDYRQYKKALLSLRQMHLPFRLIDQNRKQLSYTMDNFTRSVGLNLPSSDTSKERKLAFVKQLEDLLLAKIEPLLPNARLAQTICWLHGTTSAVLPLLSSHFCLRPSGYLLDQGIAPMCGEVAKGGLVHNGVNQHLISVETIRDIKRCWKYATETGNTFNKNKYADGERFFVNAVAALKKALLEGNYWDPEVINLMQFKQWDPEQFVMLCKKYEAEITATKDAVNKKSNFKEYWLIKAASYDIEKLRHVLTNDEVKKEVEEYFSEANPLLGKNWISTLSQTFSFSNFLKEPEIIDQEIISENFYQAFWRTIKLRLEGPAHLEKCKSTLEKVYNTYPQLKDHPEQLKFIPREELLKLLSFWELEQLYYLLHFSKSLGGDLSVDNVIDKFVIEKMNCRMQKNNYLFGNRQKRVLQLFDAAPSIFLNDSDKQFITEAFPLLFASTKKPSIPGGTEFNITHAKLGEDIDLIFTLPENKAEVEAWLQRYELNSLVKVKTYEELQPLEGLPLKHADGQVYGDNLLMSEMQHETLNNSLNDFVLPLYKASYPDGSRRKYHGVVHSMRVMLFALIAAELYKFKDNVSTLLLGAALHDAARLNDGVDLWDKESGQLAASLLQSKLGLDSEMAEKISQSIADKESKMPFCLEQKIIHDADCIDIIRALRRVEDFDHNRLWLFQELDSDITLPFLRDAQELIVLTEEEAIKDMIETSQDPYICLLQVIDFAYRHFQRFDFLRPYLIKALNTFAKDSSYILTPDIEKAIEKHFQKA